MLIDFADSCNDIFKPSDKDQLYVGGAQTGGGGLAVIDRSKEGEQSGGGSLASRIMDRARNMLGAVPAGEETAGVKHVVTLWRNGFTLDDGPVRAMGDPENQEFRK